MGIERADLGDEGEGGGDVPFFAIALAIDGLEEDEG